MILMLGKLTNNLTFSMFLRFSEFKKILKYFSGVYKKNYIKSNFALYFLSMNLL